jgi:uncharacterized protein YecE (DUF72 family)
MAIKVGRDLTHVNRLRDPEEPIARFLEAAGGLGEKLGPVLVQTPPWLRADTDLLTRCLRCFPADARGLRAAARLVAHR